MKKPESPVCSSPPKTVRCNRQSVVDQRAVPAGGEPSTKGVIKALVMLLAADRKYHGDDGSPGGNDQVELPPNGDSESKNGVVGG